MKIIFLDLDGVLNNWKHPDLIDEENALILRKVIDKSGAKIVLTSSNKYSFQREGLKSIEGSYLEKYVKVLKRLGIYIYDVTPYIDEDKSKEIKAYLDSNPFVTSFVIIDDELVDESLWKYQVYIDLYKGLQEEHIKPCLDILEGKPNYYLENFDLEESSEHKLIRINRYHSLKK